MHRLGRLGVVAPQVLAEVATEESQRDLLALMKAHVAKFERHGIECEWLTQLVESCALYEAALEGVGVAPLSPSEVPSGAPHLRLVN
jgi:hypothetical protein